MSVQAARLANLQSLICRLEQQGLHSREAQSNYLGRPVTANKLQTMLDGAYIPALFAGHVEHVLSKPRGWMSEVHTLDALREMEAA